jgi:uncharacterized membrane protein YraQ (UPF0718 family)
VKPAPPQRLTPWALLRSQWLLLFAAGLLLLALANDPAKAQQALAAAARLFVYVIPLLLAVMGLVGLIQAWISPELVARLLGREGGWRALLLAAACGMILIGPAYLIFPLLAAVQRQGARWAVIGTVLTTYAVKVQMIPLEAGYLGWRFSLVRTVLTLALAIPAGLLLEWLVERGRRGE